MNRAPFNYDELEEVRLERLAREEVVKKLEHLEHIVRKHEEDPSYMTGGPDAKISAPGGATAPYPPPVVPPLRSGARPTEADDLIRQASEMLDAPGALADQLRVLESDCDRLMRIADAFGFDPPSCWKKLVKLRFGLTELRARLWQDLQLLIDGYSPDGQMRSEEDMQDMAKESKGKINEINAALGDPPIE